MYPNPLCDTIRIRNSSVPPAYMLSQHLEEFGRCRRSCSPRSTSACANLSVNVHPQPPCPCCLTDTSQHRR